MDSVVILGHEKPVGFIDADPERPLDRALLLAGLREVAELIDRTAWTETQRDAFNGMLQVVFFQGRIEVNGYALERPGCDEDDAIFYWEAVEFLANPDPRVRANTLFHDCWHVVQFKRDGWAKDEAEREAREVDAIDEQIKVAEALGCETRDIDYLRQFGSDSQLIVARLKEGVDNMHHA